MGNIFQHYTIIGAGDLKTVGSKLGRVFVFGLRVWVFVLSGGGGVGWAGFL